jgi:hypothetical protein
MDALIMGDGSGCTGQCDLSARSDCGLVVKIMRTVERYNRDEHINPDPRSLRDTMLAVAALLHIEAIKICSANWLAAAGDGEQIRNAFASAACCQLDAVVEAATTIRRDQTGEYQ